VAADGAYRKTGVWHSTPVSLLSVEGIGPSAPEADLARIAPKHPVFPVVP
jgi:hypothetical protein